MALNNYYTGNIIRVSAAFTVSGVATDPTTVTLSVKDPTGTVNTPAPVKDSTGNYHADIAVGTIVGSWYYRFSGTGACVAAAETEFVILPTQF